MPLNYFDMVIIFLLLLFMLRGLVRGFVAEVAGLISIVGGIWMAYQFHTIVAAKLTFLDPAWRHMAAYALIFVAVMIAVGLIARFLQKVLNLVFATWIDRIAGSLFGLAKGMLIGSVLLVLLQTFVPDAQFMKQSFTMPHLENFVKYVKSLLPQDLERRSPMPFKR